MTDATVQRMQRYSLLALLEMIAADERRAPGADGSLSHVRITPTPGLATPSREIAAVHPPSARDEGDDHWHVVATIGGLYGLLSALPPVYERRLGDDDPQGSALRALLDVFHARLLRLRFAAFRRARHLYSYDPDGSDPTGRFLRAVAGRPEGTPLAWTRQAGCRTHQPVSAGALERLIRDVFTDVRVLVRTCIPRRVTLPDPMRLGRRSSDPTVAPPHLGPDALVGRRLRDARTTIRVVIGPLEDEAYRSFLPGADANARLRQLVLGVLPAHLRAEIEVVHAAPSPPTLARATAARLGRTAWLPGRTGRSASMRFVLIP